MQRCEDTLSKQLDGREGPTFGLNSSRDLYEKLKHDSVRLSEGWHPYAAFDFLVTAWHLHHDWPKSDDSRDTARHKRRESKLPQEMILVLRAIQDLVNGSKHFQLDPQAAEKRRVQAVHTGKESSWYSYFFHENLPGVTVDTHWYFTIRVLHNLTMAYFDWVFEDAIPASDFPEELLAAIRYCNIAERKGGPSPTIWLKGIKTLE